MALLNPKILKFTHGEMSFFVSFNNDPKKISGSLDHIGKFTKKNYTYVDYNSVSHSFGNIHSEYMCDQVFALWCVIVELRNPKSCLYKDISPGSYNIVIENNILQNAFNNSQYIYYDRVEHANNPSFNFVTNEIKDGKIKQVQMSSIEIKEINLDGSSISSPTDSDNMFITSNIHLTTKNINTALQSSSIQKTQLGGNPSSHIQTGSRGGKFVVVGGRKRYLRK